MVYACYIIHIKPTRTNLTVDNLCRIIPIVNIAYNIVPSFNCIISIIILLVAELSSHFDSCIMIHCYLNPISYPFWWLYQLYPIIPSPIFSWTTEIFTDMYPMIWQYLIILIFHFDHFIATLCRIMPHYAILCHFDTAYELSHTHIYIYTSLSLSLSLSLPIIGQNLPTWKSAALGDAASCSLGQRCASPSSRCFRSRGVDSTGPRVWLRSGGAPGATEGPQVQLAQGSPWFSWVLNMLKRQRKWGST